MSDDEKTPQPDEPTRRPGAAMPSASGAVTPRDEKLYEQRRAGLIPSDAAADAKVVAARAARAKAGTAP